MSAATPRLAYLAKGYFHQDYDLVSGTPDDVIRAFQRAESLQSVQELVEDIQCLLDSAMSEADIDDLWIKRWQASYDPPYEGTPYREWFAHVLQLLQTPATS